MPEFHVYGTIIGGIYLGKVAAANEDEAVEEAMKLEKAYPSFCWSCAENCEDPIVENIKAEEIK